MPDKPEPFSPRLLAPAVLALACAAPPCPAEPPPQPAALRRGLVTRYKDNAKPAPREVVRLEPTVALALGPGEAAHPGLAADGGSVAWTGYLNVPRADTYRFRVRLRGDFRLRIGGKEVLAASAKGDTPSLAEGPEVRLEA